MDDRGCLETISACDFFGCLLSSFVEGLCCICSRFDFKPRNILMMFAGIHDPFSLFKFKLSKKATLSMCPEGSKATFLLSINLNGNLKDSSLIS